MYTAGQQRVMLALLFPLQPETPHAASGRAPEEP